MEEVRILSPTAILGYEYPASSLAAGLARRPDAICVDAGSTDGGPSYLGFNLESGAGAVLRRVADRTKLAFRVAAILAEIDKDWLRSQAGRPEAGRLTAQS